MAMDRRTLVKYLAGASAAGALAGCISTEDPDDDGNGGNGGNGDDDDSQEYEEDEDWPTVEPEGVSGNAEIWHSLSEGEQADFEGNIDQFNGDYDVTVSADEIAELEEQITASIPAGEGPEMHMWAHDWAGRDYEAGFLSDQSDRLRIDLEEYFVPGAVDAAQYDGATIGLPHAAETVGLIYNKDYVDEPPETFEEMQEIMDEHHDPAEGTYGLSYPLDPYFYSAWVHGFGGYYYDDDSGELGLTNEESIRGFEFIKEELFEPYMAADYEYDAQASVFLEGNAPFAFNGPWFVGDVTDFEVGTAPWPEVNGHTPSPYSGFQLMYFTSEMDEDEERADAAVAFAEWYTSNTAIVSQMADQHGFIPVHNAFVEDDDEADELPDAVQGFAGAVEQGIPMPASPEMNQVWEPTEDEFIAYLTDSKSIEDAMEDAEARIRDAWD